MNSPLKTPHGLSRKVLPVFGGKMFHRAPENAKTLRPFPAKSLQVAVERTMFAPSCRIFTFSLDKIVYSQEMFLILYNIYLT